MIYKGSLDAFYPTTDPGLFLQFVQKVKKLPAEKILPAHHQLEIPVGLIAEIEAGFLELSAAGKLEQGNRVFDFGEFQIHI